MAEDMMRKEMLVQDTIKKNEIAEAESHSLADNVVGHATLDTGRIDGNKEVITPDEPVLVLETPPYSIGEEEIAEAQSFSFEDHVVSIAPLAKQWLVSKTETKETIKPFKAQSRNFEDHFTALKSRLLDDRSETKEDPEDDFTSHIEQAADDFFDQHGDWDAPPLIEEEITEEEPIAVESVPSFEDHVNTVSTALKAFGRKKKGIPEISDLDYREIAELVDEEYIDENSIIYETPLYESDDSINPNVTGEEAMLMADGLDSDVKFEGGREKTDLDNKMGKMKNNTSKKEIVNEHIDETSIVYETPIESDQFLVPLDFTNIDGVKGYLPVGKFLRKEWLSILLALITLLGTYMDTIFDIILVADFVHSGNYWWAGLTLGILMLSMFISSATIFKYIRTEASVKCKLKNRETLIRRVKKCFGGCGKQDDSYMKFEVVEIIDGKEEKNLSSIFMDEDPYLSADDLQPLADNPLKFNVKFMVGKIYQSIFLCLGQTSYLELCLIHFRRLASASSKNAYVRQMVRHATIMRLMIKLRKQELFFEIIPQFALQYYIILHQDSVNLLQIIVIGKLVLTIFFTKFTRSGSDQKFAFKNDGSFSYIILLAGSTVYPFLHLIWIATISSYAAILEPRIIVGVGIYLTISFVCQYLVNKLLSAICFFIKMVLQLVLFLISVSGLFGCMEISQELGKTSLSMCNASRIITCNIMRLNQPNSNQSFTSTPSFTSTDFWLDTFTCPSNYHKELFIALSSMFLIAVILIVLIAHHRWIYILPNNPRHEETRKKMGPCLTCYIENISKLKNCGNLSPERQLVSPDKV